MPFGVGERDPQTRWTSAGQDGHICPVETRLQSAKHAMASQICRAAELRDAILNVARQLLQRTTHAIARVQRNDHIGDDKHVLLRRL